MQYKSVFNCNEKLFLKIPLYLMFLFVIMWKNFSKELFMKKAMKFISGFMFFFFLVFFVLFFSMKPIQKNLHNIIKNQTQNMKIYVSDIVVSRADNLGKKYILTGTDNCPKSSFLFNNDFSNEPCLLLEKGKKNVFLNGERKIINIIENDESYSLLLENGTPLIVMRRGV